jgi:hypothetical protein
MNEFLLIGAPFALFLVASAWVGYSIGKTAAGPGTSPADTGTSPGDGAEASSGARAGLRKRLWPAVLILLAAALTALGAAAATAAGAFARLTDAGFAVEPAALLFLMETLVELALAIVIVLPTWSAGRSWILRSIGAYWLCLAIPTMILADGGTGWISANPGFGMTLLGLPSFGWEAAAVVLPALLLWRASQRRQA